MHDHVPDRFPSIRFRPEIIYYLCLDKPRSIQFNIREAARIERKNARNLNRYILVTGEVKNEPTIATGRFEHYAAERCIHFEPFTRGNATGLYIRTKINTVIVYGMMRQKSRHSVIASTDPPQSIFINFYD